MRFGSVCSGVEAASVAWASLGWKAAWFSEIEPFPCEVLKHHFPDVTNMGDMTLLPERIASGEVEPPDMLCGGTPCFAADTMVLTSNGYKAIEKIQVGDLVVTHKGRLRKVIRTGSKIAKTGYLRMVGHPKPFVCTPNHPFYSLRWKRYVTGSRRVVEKVSEPAWVSAENLEGMQWMARTFYEIDSPNIPSAKFADSPEKAMLFLGMYLGDGYIRRFTNKNKKAVVLCLNQRKLSQFKLLFGDIAGSIAECRTAYKVTLYDTALANFIINEFGELSSNKRIPAWVLSHPHKEALLRGYTLTDGHLDPSGNKFSATSVSKPLAYGIADLLNSCGFVAGVNFVPMPPTCCIEGRICNQKSFYQIRAVKRPLARLFRDADGFLCRTVKGYEKTDAMQPVYNIEVEEDHSYIAEGAITHNCQAFSYAGKRRSLDDYRGNLTLTFCEIADSIDHVRTICGDEPCIIFWENVPGVLSTKDNAFGCFLGQLVGADAPLSSGAKRWPSAGVVAGPKRKAAWRVLDAQHFGVPQRRRRVFVVASARERVDPAKILFERKGVCGDSEKGGSQRKGIAPAAHGRASCQDKGAVLSLDRASFNQGKNAQYEFSIIEGMAQTLTARGPSAVCYDMTHACDVIRESGTVTPTLQARMGTGGNQIPLVLGEKERIYNTQLSYGVVKEETVCETHTAQMDNQTDMPLVISENGSDRTVRVGITPPLKTTTPCHCLTGRESADATVFRICSYESNSMKSSNPNSGVFETDISPTLDVSVPTPAKGQGGLCIVSKNETARCYCLAENTIGREPKNGGNGLGVSEDIGFTLNATGVHGVMQCSHVRRLTPVECERLQGFPDNWTLIPYRGKTEENCPDAPRYKAIGNSWAVPVVRWLGQRIKDHME